MLGEGGRTGEEHRRAGVKGAAAGEGLNRQFSSVLRDLTTFEDRRTYRVFWAAIIKLFNEQCRATFTKIVEVSNYSFLCAGRR